MAKTVLGHLDCPCCGYSKGVRVTPDRNGEPFGFCEGECGFQMRIGGNARRVAKFISRYPWAGGKVEDQAQEPQAKTEAAPEVKPAAKPAAVAAPVPAKKKSSAGVFDNLLGAVA